ncbi:MAG: hypothetical protein IH975_11030 [Nitrospinae bacterium]|nr:hypothetical protein [Nitrospinota bacterium]
MILDAIKNLVGERQLTLSKAARHFLKRILSLSTLPVHEKEQIARRTLSWTHNPHIDLEKYEQELSYLLDRIRRAVKPHMQEEFLQRMWEHFWALQDEAEAEAMKEGYFPPREEHYTKVINKFTLSDIKIDLARYCREERLC